MVEESLAHGWWYQGHGWWFQGLVIDSIANEFDNLGLVLIIKVLSTFMGNILHAILACRPT